MPLQPAGPRQMRWFLSGGRCYRENVNVWRIEGTPAGLLLSSWNQMPLMGPEGRERMTVVPLWGLSGSSFAPEGCAQHTEQLTKHQL